MYNLIKLYEINSPSRYTKKMRGFIIAALKSIDGVNFKVEKGNIYAWKGIADSYPCVIAHLDEVHSPNSDKTIIATQEHDMIFGFDTKGKDYCGIGADDKNGIWVCVEMMKCLDVCKVAFFKDEEIGCVGSSNANMDFFSDCRFVLQCDQKGDSDFIVNASETELCDNSFYKICRAKNFHYKKSSGTATSLLTLKGKGLKCACANLSCGYYNPHTSKEFTIFSELRNCLNLVLYICKNVDYIVQHEYSQKM